MKKPEIIVLDTSDEAASIQTVTGWVSRGGRFWGNDERMARYDGSTHKTCECGAVISQRSYCQACADKRSNQKFLAMPRAQWDGESCLYSNTTDEYFPDMDSVRDHAYDNEISLADMCLIICEPNHLRQVDGEDYFSDDIPEDGELPSEIISAFNALNEAIKLYGKVVSWSPGKFALEIPQDEAPECIACLDTGEGQAPDSVCPRCSGPVSRKYRGEP